MNYFCFLKRIRLSSLRPASLASAMAASLTLVACSGGGGGEQLVPEAFVTNVASAQFPQLLEGNSLDSQGSLFEFEVTLNQAVERGLTVTLSASSFGGTDIPTGYAKGGSECGGDVDFTFPNSVTFPRGSGNPSDANKLKLSITVCKDDLFEPNETFKLSWTSQGAAGGSLEGIIINDDPGGLNGTGSTALLPGLTAFGRDTHLLTNSSADGALGFSFDKSGDCVVDKVTGLTWQKLPAQNMKYADLAVYVATVKNSELCGHTDWRVPTANELLNLMDISKTTGNTANADFLAEANDAMAGIFWSSNERAVIGAVDAWMVDADSNGAFSLGSKATARNVRLVRGDQTVNAVCDNSNGRFTDHLNGTVSDTRTGLMWKKCPEGKTGVACSDAALPFASAESVARQLAQANNSVDTGYSDWRVPTRNELASLVNLACNNPAILSSVFPSNEAKGYITSSLDVNNPTGQIWYVDFTEGHVGIIPLANGGHLRLVRAGQ